MEDRMCVSRVAMRSGRYGETNMNPSVLRQRLWVRSVPSSNSLPRPVSEVRFALLRRADLSHAVGHAGLGSGSQPRHAGTVRRHGGGRILLEAACPGAREVAAETRHGGDRVLHRSHWGGHRFARDDACGLLLPQVLAAAVVPGVADESKGG